MNNKCSVKGCTEFAAVTFEDVVVYVSVGKSTRRYTRDVHICINHLLGVLEGKKIDGL